MTDYSAIRTEAVIPNRYSFTQNGEHRVVFGEKVQGLKDSENLLLPNATMEGLENFILSRKDYILSRKAETHVRLNTRKAEVELVIGEHGQRKLVGDNDITPVITINASSKLSSDYKEVLEAMEPDGHESPRELAEFFRIRPYLFPSVDECIRVVKMLKNTTVTISRIKKDTETDAGEREKQLKTKIEDGQIDIHWKFTVPVFENLDPVDVPVEARFEVNEDLTDVNVVVQDATGEGLRAMKRRIERDLMQSCINGIESILGIDAIPMIYVD